MQAKIGDSVQGEQCAKVKELERKAQQAREMRDFMAYKQYEKELDRARADRERQEYMGMVEDANRKQDEKQRRWRKFYEDFAHEQGQKIAGYTDKVIGP